MKTKVLLFAFILTYASSFGQPLKESEVPTVALNNFKATYYDAVKTSWSKAKEIFTAEFTLDEMKTLADYDADGEWLQTRIPMDEKEIPGPIVTYVKSNFKEERMKRSEYTEKPNKEIFYFVVMRKEGMNQPDIELYFTKAGKFIKRIDPAEVKVNNDISSQNKDTVKTNVVVNNPVTKDNSDNEDGEVKTVKKPGDTIARYKVSEKELPGPIVMYVKKNFKDEKIKVAEIQEKDNGDKCYYLEVKKDGYKQQATKLYFNLDGKILRRLDPVTQAINKDVDEMTNMDNDKSAADFVEESVPWKELPTPITNYVTKNYKGFKMKEALITKKNDLKVYQLTLRKEGFKDDHLLYFDLNGKYLKPEDLE